MGNLTGRVDPLRSLFDGGNHIGNGDINATLQIHRVHAGGDSLSTLTDDGLGQYGGGCGAVAGFVGGPRSDLLHHLSTHILELVGKLDFLGDGDTVLCNARRAERFVQYYVAAFGAERDFHSIGKRIDARQHARTGIRRKFDFLGSHCS